jgi:hypothetical protein
MPWQRIGSISYGAIYMKVRTARPSEIKYCFEQYMKQNDWLPATTEGYKKFRSILNRDPDKQLWVAEHNGSLVGFLYADKLHPIHMPFPVYQQLYCCTWDRGTVAAMAVKKLHERLFEEAEKRKLPLALSTGSHLDEDYVFTRMLERFGWERRGYLAARKTRWFRETGHL